MLNDASSSFRSMERRRKENKLECLSTGLNSVSTENATCSHTYVPEENLSGANVYVIGSSTVTELPTPSRGTVKVTVNFIVHPVLSTNLRFLDKIALSIFCPTGKLVAV